MAKMDVDEKVFQLPIDVDAAGIVTKTLATADTYVDKNIKVTVTTPDAEFEIKKDASVTATVSTTDTTYTSETETPYAIEIDADATAGAVQVGVKTAGFAAATDVVDIEAVNATTNKKTIYVKEGSISVTGDAEATGTIDLTQVGTQPTSGFYVKASASSGATVDVAGWVPTGAAGDASGDAYYTVKNIAFDNKAAAGEEYTDISDTAPILNENGYLFINEGYIANSKISLAKLVPDASVIPGVADGKSDLMYKTVSAYDNDGKLVSGTMGDAELGAITANDATATVSTVTVAAEGTGFKVTGTGTISGTASVAVSKRGLAETTLSQSGVISGEAEVNATIAKIGLGVTVDDNDVEVTPVISKEASSTAKSGDITTTAPTGRYIAVSTAAIEASSTVNPNVATEGYGTTDTYSATGDTIKAGAAASGTYYVPITAGSHTATAGDPTIVAATATVATAAEATDGFDGNLTAGIVSVAPTSGEYITINADATKTAGSVAGTVTCTATEGYIEAAQQTASINGEVDVTVTPAAAKYIRVYDGTIL